MRPSSKTRTLYRRTLPGLLLALVAGLSIAPARAQQRGGFVIKLDVDLVVLHTTVVDRRSGHQITDLKAENFTIYEDGKKQQISRFLNEDVPVTVGLVLDNSASMAKKRDQMMAGALAFISYSNPDDEFFVVNFNSDYYLDLEGKDFTNNLEEVQVALDRTATRGTTSFYDALRASITHSKRGTHQKKVIVVISDGVDNTSYSDYDTLYEEAQQTEVGLYFIVLPCTEDDEKRECRRAKRQIRKLADATGGMAYFPTSLDQVQALGHQIAQDVRNQYVIGYTPTNRTRDGSYRRVEVKVKAPKRKLEARHRPGYFANSTRQGSQ